MPQTDEGNAHFKSWLLDQNRAEVDFAESSTAKATAYQDIMDAAMSECFPVITVKRKSTEDPWITEKSGRKFVKEKLFVRVRGGQVDGKGLRK